MNTILLTVDALRADHLGQYGYHRDTMPVVDRLVEDGTCFEQAFANAPYTRISVPALHTSVRLAHTELDGLPTVSAELGTAGYTTATIGTRTGFKSAEADLMFDTYITLGRDEYHEQSPDRFDPIGTLTEIGDNLLASYPRLHDLAARAYYAVPTVSRRGFDYKGYTSAKEVTDTAIEWLNDHAEEDFFLWMHYMEGHRPYGVHDTDPAYTSSISDDRIRELMKQAGTTPEAVTSEDHQKLIDLYDSDLRYCSRHIDRLFDHLEDRGLWNETNLLFTADHGEEFHDHGEYFHRNLPYDELLHVPLIVRSPGAQPTTITEQRELIDLPPTILDLHDIESPHTFEGTSLFAGNPREVIATGSQQAPSPVVARRWDGYKYISTPSREYLFDLDADPAESQNLAEKRPELCADFREAIPEPYFSEEIDEELRDPEDAVDRERLEALGYLETKE